MIKVITPDHWSKVYMEFKYKSVSGDIIGDSTIEFNVIFSYPHKLTDNMGEEMVVDLAELASLHELAQQFKVPVEMQVAYDVSCYIMFAVNIPVRSVLESLEFQELSKCLFSKAGEVREIAANLLGGSK